MSNLLVSRAPILSRAFVQIARNGNSLRVAANTKNNVQKQLVRFSGDWTYRTAATSIPLYKRIWVQAAGGCKQKLQ